MPNPARNSGKIANFVLCFSPSWWQMVIMECLVSMFCNLWRRGSGARANMWQSSTCRKRQEVRGSRWRNRAMCRRPMPNPWVSKNTEAIWIERPLGTKIPLLCLYLIRWIRIIKWIEQFIFHANEPWLFVFSCCKKLRRFVNQLYLILSYMFYKRSSSLLRALFRKRQSNI